MKNSNKKQQLLPLGTKNSSFELVPWDPIFQSGFNTGYDNR